MNDRRHATNRPYYRQSAERDYFWAAVINFVVGAMLGATIALGWLAL